MHRRLILVASIAALIIATLAPPTFAGGTATAESADAAAAAGNTSVVYSDLYLKLITAFPSGWVLDACNAVLQVAGRGGVCSAILQLEYFYPDATFGSRPWHLDDASPTGWSLEPNPCIGLTDDEYALWAAYVDFHNGYLETGPELTTEQVDRYGACWGWWF